MLAKDEARRIAINFDKLLELLHKQKRLMSRFKQQREC